MENRLVIIGRYCTVYSFLLTLVMRGLATWTYFSAVWNFDGEGFAPCKTFARFRAGPDTSSISFLF